MFFFTPWLIVSGSKKEKAQACCKIGDFSDSSFKFHVFFHPVSRLMILFDSFVCVFTPRLIVSGSEKGLHSFEV